MCCLQEEIDKVRKRQAEREAEKARREEELVGGGGKEGLRGGGSGIVELYFGDPGEGQGGQSVCEADGAAGGASSFRAVAGGRAGRFACDWKLRTVLFSVSYGVLLRVETRLTLPPWVHVDDGSAHARGPGGP